MSLKQEIETWVAALAAYDNNEFDNSIKCFERIADTSKILFNLGVIHATLGEHSRAVECYQRAVQLDQYLAIAYFQQGVSNFLMGDFEEALANFNDTLLYLRGNNNIDYEQLGLKFKLFSCEVLFNRGLCYIYLQQKDAGLQDLIYAAREKMVPDHDVIDEAIKEQAEGYTVFSIPVGRVYRPNEAKVKNLKTKDYLGKARLVAAQDQVHHDPRRQAALSAMGVDDRPSDKLSYASLNLVRPGLVSRSRQQSEPPLNRHNFPPTPPPEQERPDSAYAGRKSSESLLSQGSSLQKSRPGGKVLRLELGAAAFEQKSQVTPAEKPRVAPKRSESERPPMRREHSNGSTRSHDNRRQEARRSIHQDVSDPFVEVEEDPVVAYSEQVSSPPRTQYHQRSRSSAHALRAYNNSIEEADEEDEDAGFSDIGSPPLAFEIIPPRSHYASPGHQRHRSHSRRPPPPEIRKLRIKVYAEADTRYVMSVPDVLFQDLAEQIRVKFGFKGSVKLKIRDEEGDMVTIGDQDDLEMAVSLAKTNAVKEKGEMAKMDVWVQEI